MEKEKIIEAFEDGFNIDPVGQIDFIGTPWENNQFERITLQHLYDELKDELEFNN